MIIMSLIAYTRGCDDVNVLGRRLPYGIERRAYCGVALYTFMALAGVMGLIVFDPRKLSRRDVRGALRGRHGRAHHGHHPVISRNASLVILILLMYAGRVGSLSVAMALSERRHANALKNPVGQIIVG